MPCTIPLVLALLAVASSVRPQRSSTVPNSFPQDYPGKPSGDFSPEWQDYFLVKDPLPNVTFSLNRNWAGNIPVNRTNHPNDTLFFWAFESKNGSLSAASDANSEPWALWLNGGPGASSMLGLLLENGPLHITQDGSMTPNNFSWDKLVDYIWVDQPVGTGFSTAESNGGYIENEDQMGEDFLNFLRNLVKIFPSLATRPLLLTGESYAGTFIPYITKTIFSTPNPPVNLSKIAIGNGAMGAEPEYEELPMLSVIETFPQLIGYDPEVYEYFREQTHLCGYDFNLTYPQTSKFPPVGSPIPPSEQARAEQLASRSSALIRKTLVAIARGVESPESGLVKRTNPPTAREVEERDIRRRDWIREKKREKEKRDLTGRANGTIDPFYGCFLSSEVQDYALNFSMPWNLSQETVISTLDDFGPFNPYDVPDARAPPLALDPTTFLNDDRTRTALHAPTSKNWTLQINYPFNSSFRAEPGANVFGDPSVEPVAFFDELATNASERGVSVIIYSGNDDTVVPHFSSEITIQNTTFGGIQGFTRKPSTPFNDDSGNFVGIVHQERNWTYVLVANSGHEVPEFTPEAALVLFREFILGHNLTGLGLITNSSISSSVVVGGGGEDPSSLLIGDILPGESAILYGSGSATSMFVAPSETIVAWETFFASVKSVEASEASASASRALDPNATSEGMREWSGVSRGRVLLVQVICVVFVGYYIV